MDEDMQFICDFLLMALQRTRAGWKVVRLVYADEPGRETVTIHYQSGGKQIVTVTGDSGIEMMRDVLKKF